MILTRQGINKLKQMVYVVDRRICRSQKLWIVHHQAKLFNDYLYCTNDYTKEKYKRDLFNNAVVGEMTPLKFGDKYRSFREHAFLCSVNVKSKQ